MVRREVQAINGRDYPRVAKGWKNTWTITWNSYYPKPILVHWMGGVIVFYGTSKGNAGPNYFGSQGGSGTTNIRQ